MQGHLKAYGFVNAKIRSRLSRLLTEENFNSMIRAGSIEEVIAELRSTDYADSMDLYASTGDVRAVEFSLNVHEIETVKEILLYLKGEPADFVRTLILRYEVDLVKNALRFWFDRLIRHRVQRGGGEYLYEKPLIHRINLDHIINAPDEDEMLEALRGSPYYDLVRRNIGIIKEEKHMFPVELELDEFFYQELFNAVQKMDKKDRQVAERILRVEVDLQNIDRIVRFVSFYGTETRKRFQLFLPGGSIGGDVLGEAYRQEGAEEALSVLLSKSYTGYRAFTAEHRSTLYARLNLVEGLLRQILNDEVRRLLHGYPFTIGTVIAYVFLKRREIHSLIRIINAKYYGLSEEKIREVL